MRWRAGQADLSGCRALWVRGPRDSLVPACRCQSVTGLDFGGSSADVKVQSAEWLRRSGRLAGRAGTPDEIGDLAEFLLSSRGRFISGADFLADGGCTSSYWDGDLQYLKATH